MRKLLSVILALTMIVSSVTTVAFAAPSATNNVQVAEEVANVETVIEETAELEGDETSVEGLSGEGTEESPYLINNLAELVWFRDDVNAGSTYEGKFVLLTSDIDLTGKVWTPIGTSIYDKTPDSSDVKMFAGNFDGGNHTITGLTSDGYIPAASETESTEYSFGLFGYVYGANISNIKLADVDIDCRERDDSDGNKVCGSGIAALVGYYVPADGKTVVIENCHVLSGTVEATNNMGGLIGYMHTQLLMPEVDITVKDCSNAADVTTDAREAGGILGYLGGSRTDIEHLSIRGTITFKNCVNTGDITSLGTTGNSSAGGIVGCDRNEDSWQRAMLIYDSCTNSGTITAYANGETHAGGIGTCYYSIQGTRTLVKNCINTGNVVVLNPNGDEYVGGLVSHGGIVEINNSTNTGTVTVGEDEGNKYIGDADILFLNDMRDFRDVIGGTTYFLNDGVAPGLSDMHDGSGNYNFFPVKTAAKDGFEFGGWYDTADFTGNLYSETENIRGVKNLTLYAKWIGSVAKIGDDYFETLEEALAAANAGDMIVLNDDIVLEDTLVIAADKEIILDLNGKSISQEKACTAHYTMIENKGTLTITGDGKISFTDTGAGDANFGWGSYTLINRGTLVVENGTIENLSTQNPGNGQPNVHMYCAIQQAGGTVTINGGKVSNPTYRSIRVNKGELVINGGEFEGQIWLQPNQGDASLEVTGGTFAPSGNDGSSIFMTNAGENYTVSSAEISGGTFETKIGATDASALAGAITGGTFTEAAKEGTNEALISSTLVFGEVVDGYYDLVDKTEWNIETKEDLLEFAAIANAGDTFSGKTVTLMADIDLGGMTWTPITKFSGKFDGNDFTISNFKIDATSTRVGFFQALSWAVVEDLNLEDVTATVGNRYGTLVYSIDQTCIKNVNVKNVNVTTTSSSALVAGLACAGTVNSDKYLNDCTVENLTVNAENGATLIGGIITFVQKNGTEAEGTNVFENLHVKNFKVIVNGTGGGGVGGLVTQTQSVWQNPHFKNCSVTGLDVTATGKIDVGGFMCAPGSYTYATNCTVEGKIDVTGVTSADNYAGGFFGDYGWGDNVGKGDHKVTNCSADVDIITNVATAGGFVGSGTNTENRNKNITLTNCEAKGTVTCVEGGTATIGGFAGNTDRGIYNACSAPAGSPFIGEELESSNTTITCVACVGNTYFASLTEAIAAAQDGDTVVLLDDVVLDATLTVNKSITIDGDGHALVPVENTSYLSALMIGDSGWGDDMNTVSIKLENLEISGWNTSLAVVRVQGVSFEMDGCTLSNNTVTNVAYSVLSLNYANSTVKNCVFEGNTAPSVIDVNYNADGSTSVNTIENCTFKSNTCSGAGVIYKNAGKVVVDDSTFYSNTVSTNGNAATVYTGWGFNDAVTDCIFKNNAVVTSHATTKRFASAIFCDGTVVNGNAFDNNTATRNGETVTTTVAVGAYYGAADVSENYFDGAKPVLGVDYTVEFATRNEVTLNTCYTDYSVDADGNVVLDGLKDLRPVKVYTYEELIDALAADAANVIMMNDITATATQSSGYGKAGIVVDAGDVLDGNGYKLTINDANGTWDCSVAMRGGTVKNLTVAGAMRGVFMPGANGDVVIDNCVFEDVIYTFNSDAGSANYSVTINNTELYGWTSFSNVHKSVTFDGCTFGEGSGYAFLRPYQATTFVDCEFNEGFEFDTTKSPADSYEFDSCTYAGEALSEDNGWEMFYNGGDVVVDGADVTYSVPQALIDEVKYKTLQDAVNAAADGDEITINTNFALDKTVKVANGKTITINLNEKTITGTDKNVTGNFYLIDNRGNLTITGNGKITLTAETNREWNSSSVVVANNPGGKLVIENGTFEHLGGTDMAYAVDNLTNGKNTYAETIINGGTIKSTYRAVRQFLNGIEADNILTINGGVIEGANKSVWMHDPSVKANSGKLTVSDNATLNGDVYLFVTAGSTAWPVEVSIAATAVNGDVLSANVPLGYEVVENDGYYGVRNFTPSGYTVTAIASETEVRYNNNNTADSFTVKYVVTGGDVIGAMAQFKYDNTMFTCAEDSDGDGVVRMNSYTLTTDANGETLLKELTFTVKANPEETKDCLFTAEYVQVVSDYDAAGSGAQDGFVENVVGAVVTVVAQYDVTLPADDSLAGDILVDAGADYQATINNFDENKVYTIKYTMEGVDGEQSVEVTKDNLVNGGFVIENVTGNIVFTSVETELNCEIVLLPDAVTGYTLVMIKNGTAAGYNYNGTAMFSVERYVGLTQIVDNVNREAFVGNILEATSVRALLVEGAVTEDSVRQVLTATDTASEVIDDNLIFDVNNNGQFYYNDAMTALGCYTKQYNPVEDYMVWYLRADVNIDFVVDTADYNAAVTEFWSTLD